MHRLYFLFLIFSVTSCNYFEKKKTSSKEILEEELKTFNWNDIDTYPKFLNKCDSIIEKQESKACFQSTLITNVNRFLAAQNIKVTENINDTIRLKIEINKEGIPIITPQNIKHNISLQIPNIDSLLRQSLKGIKIYPAIKRGQEVTIAFELPVIIKIK